MNKVRTAIGAEYAYRMGIYGANVGIAVLDTGIVAHPDFVKRGNRILQFQDFINGRQDIYDDAGHGTHICGIAGGDGNASAGRYMGIAPACRLIVLKVLDAHGDGNVPQVVQALQWILQHRKEYGIRVVNLSFGMGAQPDSVQKREADERMLAAVEEVWDAGLVVVAAAGNNGPAPGSVTLPGSSRKIITVGASDDNLPAEVFGRQRVQYSGCGPTADCVMKPDIVAPAGNIVSCAGAVRGSRYGKRGSNAYYVSKSGTSMATPVVAGAVALLLSKEPWLTNKAVKLRLRTCASDLGKSRERQGWGLLWVPKLLVEP